jgi:hypothetical protein
MVAIAEFLVMSPIKVVIQTMNQARKYRDQSVYALPAKRQSASKKKNCPFFCTFLDV